ncbi:hypothetical protein [Mammaliicoccus sp. H-M33]|nr:hypothetical protein [Mammaliicoccus sp. H-M33]
MIDKVKKRLGLKDDLQNEQLESIIEKLASYKEYLIFLLLSK